MKPRVKQLICYLSSLLLFLVACTGPIVTGFQTQSEVAGIVADYLLKVSERFSIQAIDPAHQQTIDQQVKLFESDLGSGKVDSYYQNPSFSILLAAGSEGNFFNSKEGIEQIGKTGAVFAQVVVFDPNQPAKIFKGQFSNGRFYFAGENQAVFSPLNTAYLISLDLNLETKIFKGQLVAGSEGNFIRPGTGLPAELAAGSEGNFLREPSASELAEKRKTYQAILLKHREQGAAYGRKVSEFKITEPEFPLGLAWTETFARLMRAYPDQMTLGLTQIRGLPRDQLDEAWKDLVERYREQYRADCGVYPPDTGNLYPQRLAGQTPIPQGYQSEALDKVILDIPEFQTALKDLGQTRRPPEQMVTLYLKLLNQFLKSHPDVFAKHQWSDEFAPPACVKPRFAQPGVLTSLTGGAAPPPIPPPRPNP